MDKPNLACLDNRKLMEFLSIITEKDGKIYPTIAALMIFGLYPQAFYPQLVVTAVVIPGTQMGETGDLVERFVDNKKIEGTIPQMIDHTVDFIVKNMKVRTIIREDNAKRDDKTEYPIPAIRETVINALELRDYSTYTEGMSIQVRMFNDRIEIQNPGGLYGEVSIDEIMSSKKDIRNKNAVRILEDLKVLENRGSGIPTILREMRELKLEPPKFEERRGDFWVTFKNHTLLTKQDNEWLKNFKMDFTENEALALSFIRKNEVMTNSDYQKLCNLNRDRSLIEIKGLLNKGLIKAQGVGRGTVYMFSDIITQSDDIVTPKDNLSPPKMTPKDNSQPPKMTPKDDVDNVEKLLSYCVEAHSKKEILEYLGLSDAKNMEKTYLYPLLNEGKLKMTLPNKPSSKNQKYETVRKLT